jgi:hypothetical protein
MGVVDRGFDALEDSARDSVMAEPEISSSHAGNGPRNSFDGRRAHEPLSILTPTTQLVTIATY